MYEIWHETYIISPGKSESIYINMPKYGLAAAGTLHHFTGRRANAKNRMNFHD